MTTLDEGVPVQQKLRETMKTLERGQDKIKEICKVLREETLQPAQVEADQLIGKAKEDAAEILRKAEAEAKQMHEAARSKIEQERTVFQSSLKQAGKQALETLRQDIEQRLFNAELGALVEKGSSDSQLVARIIDSLIEALQQQGIKADLTAVIPEAVDAQKVTQAMAKASTEKLKSKPLALGKFAGGAQLKWHDRKLTIDMTDAALKELLSAYVRKDFRELLFGE